MTLINYFGKLKAKKLKFASGEVTILCVTSPAGDVDALNGDIIHVGGRKYTMTTTDIKNGIFKKYPELAQLVLKAAEARMETTEL
jgi:hypothetical protein